MSFNKREILKALDFLLDVDLKDLTEEKEYAIERCFEIVGGVLKELVAKNVIKQTPLIKNAIKTRDKISHFYYGLNVQLINDAIEDLKEIKKVVDKI